MKIVFVIPGLGFGGAERVVSILASEFAKSNDVRIVLTSGNNQLAYPLSENIDLKILDQNVSVIKRWFHLRKLCLDYNADVVIAFMHTVGIMTSTFLAFTKIPVIVSERNDPSQSDRQLSPLFKFLDFFATRSTSGYIFQSTGALEFYPKKCRKKSRIILNPIDKQLLPTRDTEHIEKSIVTVGRLHSQKNQRMLINAFAKSEFCSFGYTLHIYGDGPLRSELEQQILDLSLSNQVFLEGNKSDALDKIKNASLFVLTSNYEGLPNALMEAMAIGIPCVSTDCSPGGARMLIKSDNSNGYIVPCNDESSLTKIMDFLYENPKKLYEIGRNGRQILNKTDVKYISRQWQSFIESLVQKKKDSF